MLIHGAQSRWDSGTSTVTQSQRDRAGRQEAGKDSGCPSSQLLQAFGLAKSLGRIRSFLWSLLERIKLTRDFFRKYSSFVFKYATYTLTSKFSVLNLIFSVWWDSLGWFQVKKVQVKVKCTFRRVFSSLLHCCLGGSCLVLRVSVHVC